MKNTIKISVGLAALIAGAAPAGAQTHGSGLQNSPIYEYQPSESLQGTEAQPVQQGADAAGATAGARGGQASVEQAERNAAAARLRTEERAEQPGAQQDAKKHSVTGENRTTQGQALEQGREQTGQNGASEPPKARGESTSAAEQGGTTPFDQQQQSREAQQSAQEPTPLAQDQEPPRPGAAPQETRRQPPGWERAQGLALSPDQQDRIRDTVRNDKIARRNSWRNVGAVVPRGERLAVLPGEVVAIVPQYRGYRFAIVEEDIVIVDPRTYRVVAVIPERAEPRPEPGGPIGGPRGPGGPLAGPPPGPGGPFGPVGPIGPIGRTCRC